MNGKRRTALLCAAGLLLVLASCKKPGSPAEAKTQYYDTILYQGFASGDGIYHQNSTGFLYFFDYRTRQDVIVCNKPNCTHSIWYENTPDEQRCNAYLPSALGGAGFVAEDFLYLFNVDLNTQTASLVRSGLDRTSEKEIARFENNIISPFVVDGQYLYLSGCAILMQKDEDGMEQPTGENEVWLFRVDLRTGEMKKLTERKKGYGSDLHLAGMYNGRLYYRESYFKTRYDGTNYKEAGHQVDWYSFDIQTGQAERIFEGEQFQEAYLYKNKLAGMYGKDPEGGREAESRYGQYELTVWGLDTGESQPAGTADRLPDYADGKVFYTAEEDGQERSYCYDIENGKTMEQSRKFMERLHIRGAFGDYMLVVKDDPDTGIGDYYVILKEDFYNGKEQFVPITWDGET